MKKIILMVSMISIVFIACKKDDSPNLIEFTHTIDGVALTGSSLINAELAYTNALDQYYNVQRLNYLISDITLYADNGDFTLLK